MTIVAISRELGSGGNAIAAAVAKALSFEYVEREIILQAAHALSSEVKSCRGCHDKGGAVEDSRGMMDCSGCHFTGRVKHP